jgi:hypothetical protein
VSPLRYELCFYIPEDDILHSHRRENLKPYTYTAMLLPVVLKPTSSDPTESSYLPLRSCAVVQAASRHLSTAASRIRALVKSCAICDGQKGTWAGFSPIHSTDCSIVIAVYHPGLV